MKNGEFKQPNYEFTRNVNCQLKMEWNLPSADQDLCNNFSTKQAMAAIKTLQAGKAPGHDNLHPECFFFTPWWKVL